MMQPETAMLQRLAPRWQNRQLLLINPPDARSHYAGLNLIGVVHDNYRNYQTWKHSAPASLYVWFATQIPELALEAPPVMVIFIPKGKARLTAQLQLLGGAILDGADVVLLGAIKSGIKSAGKILQQCCRDVHKLDAARHCQAWAGELAAPGSPDTADFFTSWSLHLPEFAGRSQSATVPVAGLQVHTLPGVFASGHLDAGSQLLLQTLCEHHGKLPRSGQLLDYGCGCGVLSLALHQLLPNLHINAVDDDAWALAASQKTLAGSNSPVILPSAGAADIGGRYDLIVSNPPFHQSFSQSTGISTEFLQSLPQLLAPRGQCWLVANRFLAYEHIINKTGLKFETIRSTPQYKIIRIVRR